MPQTSTRKHVLNTALILASRHGFDNVPLREIAFDAAVPEAEVKELFPSKSILLEEIFQYITENLVHYNPTVEDIDELLATETPDQILLRYVSYYDNAQNQLIRSIYRFSFMHQFRSKETMQFVDEYITSPPMQNAMETVNLLMERGAIPACDAAVITDMWNRTSLIYEMLSTHDNIHMDYDEYVEMTLFFIRFITRGVKLLDIEPFPARAAARTPEALNEDQDRNTILHHALSLFVEQGYSKTNICQISQKSGVPLQMIYSLYRSKSEVMRAIVDVILNNKWTYNPVFENILVAQDYKQVVRTITDSFAFTLDRTARDLYHILFREQYHNEDLKDYLIGSLYMDIEKITAQLDHMVEEGILPKRHTAKVAKAFVFSMCSYTIGAIERPDQYERIQDARARIIISLVSYLINGYTIKE